MEWFIIVLLTMGKGIASEEILTDLRFKTEQSCKEYVVKNYDLLNERVNKNHEQHKSTPNLYHCITGVP